MKKADCIAYFRMFVLHCPNHTSRTTMLTELCYDSFSGIRWCRAEQSSFILCLHLMNKCYSLSSVFSKKKDCDEWNCKNIESLWRHTYAEAYSISFILSLVVLKSTCYSSLTKTMAWQLELQKYHINTCFHALAWALASESQEVSVRSLQLKGGVALRPFPLVD